MLKIFVTGDNHIGKKYDRYPDVKERLIQSRFGSMQEMVREAERQGCGLFVITGDLFDNINTIKVSDVKQVVEILAGFAGTVLVLPGNHDYYTGEEKVWKDFEKVVQEQGNHIVLLKELREYSLEVGEEHVVVYPAGCQSKHSRENNLDWIKNADMEAGNCYHIGIAHGAIKGITPDMKEEYFLMTESELLDIPVDVWLIGHTHISYPVLKETEDMVGYRIFNAGTHEQTDLHNRTEGYCFVIGLEKVSGTTRVSARRYKSGRIHYYDLTLEVTADAEDALQAGIRECVANIQPESVVRLKISGTVKAAEYEDRKKIYRDVLGHFLTYECVDTKLSEEITIEKIRTEFPEISFAAKFMEQLMDNPVELQMTYNLLQECRE